LAQIVIDLRGIERGAWAGAGQKAWLLAGRYRWGAHGSTPAGAHGSRHHRRGEPGSKASLIQSRCKGSKPRPVKCRPVSLHIPAGWSKRPRRW